MKTHGKKRTHRTRSRVAIATLVWCALPWPSPVWAEDSAPLTKERIESWVALSGDDAVQAILASPGPAALKKALRSAETDPDLEAAVRSRFGSAREWAQVTEKVVAATTSLQLRQERAAIEARLKAIEADLAEHEKVFGTLAVEERSTLESVMKEVREQTPRDVVLTPERIGKWLETQDDEDVGAVLARKEEGDDATVLQSAASDPELQKLVKKHGFDSAQEWVRVTARMMIASNLLTWTELARQNFELERAFGPLTAEGEEAYLRAMRESDWVDEEVVEESTADGAATETDTELNVSGVWTEIDSGFEIRIQQTGRDIKAIMKSPAGRVVWRQRTGSIDGDGVVLEGKGQRVEGRVTLNGSRITFDDQTIWKKKR